MKKQGIFVCIEGLDGSGKTTHALRLVQNLKKVKVEAIYTAEPSSGEIGRYLRTRVLHRKKRIPAVVETLLFAIDRIHHVEKEITPALDEGKVVVVDRYVYSSLAYQGATGLDLEWINFINRLVRSQDLAIFIDVPPEVVVERIRRKKTIMENLKTQRKVRKIYLDFVEEGKLARIDGNRKKHEVEKDVFAIVLNLIERRKAASPAAI